MSARTALPAGVDPSVLHAGARAGYVDAAWLISAVVLLALAVWTLARAATWRRRAERAANARRPS